MMFKLQRFASLTVRGLSPVAYCSRRVSSRRWSSTIPHEPLRVLFCGADQFSIYSLKALNDIRLKHPDKVASIDVVCKKDKRVGRGLKTIQEVPIKKVALEELGLPLHQIDTFTGWTPPQPTGEPINLVVAVSFGLLVPPRILNAAKYGGLNVHPSMLPDLRGPAPLHHTLLNRLEKTGVTLQTLHPQHFDQGRIVDQTPAPGLDIPGLSHANIESLLQFVGPLGADMLERNIRTGSFARPHGQLQHMPQDPDADHAAKITTDDKEIWWPVYNANDLELRDRVLGRTWAEDIQFLVPGEKRMHRVTFHGWKDTTAEFNEMKHHHQLISFNPNATRLDYGVPMVLKDDPEKRLFFTAADSTIASPSLLTVEGKPKTQASAYYQHGIEHGSPLLTTTPDPDTPPTGDRSSASYRPMVWLEVPLGKRKFSTSTHRRTRSPLPPSPPADTPQISWDTWTTSTLEKNTTCTSSDPILHHLSVPHSPQSVTLMHCQDANIDYRKLIYKGGDLYTSLPSSTPLAFGAPLFISKDKAKRVFFWVWGNPERSRVEVVSPRCIAIGDGKAFAAEELWERYMGNFAGGEKARLVGVDELREFNLGKKRASRVEVEVEMDV